MPEDTHADVRKLLTDLAADVPFVAPAPERTTRRARRRAGVTVAGGSLVAAAVIAALVVGIGALPEPDRDIVREPPVPTETGTYIYELDSGAFTLIDGLPDDARQLDVSADGTRLAFVSEQEGSPQIYVSNLDGTGVERITDDPVYAFEPAWSPEGDTIVFVGTGSNAEHRELYLVDPDTQETHRVEGARVEPQEPEWSRDGRFIVFLVLEDSLGLGNNALFVHDVRRDRSTRLSIATEHEFPAGGATWSPDGTMLAYPAAVDASGIDILVRGALAGGPGISLFSGPGEDLGPTYSPDGSFVALWSEGPDGISTSVIDAGDGHALHVLRGASAPTWVNDQMLVVQVGFEGT